VGSAYVEITLPMHRLDTNTWGKCGRNVTLFTPLILLDTLNCLRYT